MDAATRILTDPDRQLPTGSEPVQATAFDFREGRSLKGLECDFAFTDLSRDQQHRATVQLLGSDGATAELWADPSYPYIEVFTADTLAADRRRGGLGVEPMTCPPNALQQRRAAHPTEAGRLGGVGMGRSAGALTSRAPARGLLALELVLNSSKTVYKSAP